MYENKRTETVYDLIEENGRMDFDELVDETSEDIDESEIRDILYVLSEQHRIVWGSDFKYRTVEK